MQTTDTTLSPVTDLAEPEWVFTEAWIDPMLSPPYLLLLLCNEAGHCQIHDPAEGYKAIFSSANYEEAQLWLSEDEYERVDGRLLAKEAFRE
ncbi:MAG: hypothetical protein AAFV72_08130 [Cyanobacteria bacterium J06635_1]